MSNISPGVYTKIIDLSAYVQAVPSTVGFICALTKKGRDNEVLFLGGRGELIGEWGEPDITTYGKNYGQGQYCAYNFLGESGSLYYMRCMPDNAAYANIRIDAIHAAGDTTTDIQLTWIDGINSKDEIVTNLEYTPGSDTYPICILYPIGRGDYYNGIAIRLTRHANPMVEGVYILDIYEKQDDGDEVIIESFNVSFEPTAKDVSGDSIFIIDILEKYSSILRGTMTLANGDYTSGYNLAIRSYDWNQGWSTVTTVVETSPGSNDYNIIPATLTDGKQDFSPWQNATETGLSEYCVIAIDQRGNRIWGWLGAASGSDNETINVFDNRNLSIANQTWLHNLGDPYVETPGQQLSHFDWEGSVTYYIRKELVDLSAAFLSSDPIPLRKGFDGDLLDLNGNLNYTEAERLLAAGYAGQIDDNILDTEKIYFTMVFDCG